MARGINGWVGWVVGLDGWVGGWMDWCSGWGGRVGLGLVEWVNRFTMIDCLHFTFFQCVVKC